MKIHLWKILLLFLLSGTVNADVHPSGEPCSGPICDMIQECNFLIERFGDNPTLFEYVVSESEDKYVVMFCTLEGIVIGQNSPFEFLPNNKGLTKFSLLTEQITVKGRC